MVSSSSGVVDVVAVDVWVVLDVTSTVVVVVVVVVGGTVDRSSVRWYCG